MCASVEDGKVDVTTVSIQQIDCEIINNEVQYDLWCNDLIKK